MNLRESIEGVLREIRGQFEETLVSAVDYVASGQIITDPLGVQSMGAPDGTQFLAELLSFMALLYVGVRLEKYLKQTVGNREQ